MTKDKIEDLPLKLLFSRALLLFLFMICGFIATPGFAQEAATVKDDPLGIVKSSQKTPCSNEGVAGGTCYKLVVSCPGVADISSVLKVNYPGAPSRGTIIFGAGGNGVGYYDQMFTYGETAVNSVLSAGFTTAQINFNGLPAGWMTGPGGPRKLACRYATVAQWVYNHIRKSSAEPLCATGNSGGSAAIAYSLAHYGRGSIFSMVELTSGPPQSRMDYGCICDQRAAPTSCGNGALKQCYGVKTAQMAIDQAYANNTCSSAVTSHDRTNASVFLHDSINSADATVSYPTTDVHIVFGGLDKSSAVPLGQYFANKMTTKHDVECVADAPHSLPDVLDGANKVADDLKTFCRTQ
jgi:hypothetical protein